MNVRSTVTRHQHTELLSNPLTLVGACFLSCQRSETSLRTALSFWLNICNIYDYRQISYSVTKPGKRGQARPSLSFHCSCLLTVQSPHYSQEMTALVLDPGHGLTPRIHFGIQYSVENQWPRFSQLPFLVRVGSVFLSQCI